MLALGLVVVTASAQQHSVARRWNEALLASIRRDFARPPVHARNLFHCSIALYDAWAVYEDSSRTYFLGKTLGEFSCPFAGTAAVADKRAAQEMAMSYACFRLLRHRFLQSPGAAQSLASYNALMFQLGYDITNNSTDYQSGDPAALGNYLASQLIAYGMQDGSNEVNNYNNQYYEPVNPSLVISQPGNPAIVDLNRWQPITLNIFIDQSGNVIPLNTPPFQSPEWGQLAPFALQANDRTTYSRGGHPYQVYLDPGPPPYMDTLDGGGRSEEYAWNFALTLAWSAQLSPDDEVIWDISPGGLGRISHLPTTFEEYQTFYDILSGATPTVGHAANPVTGQPYSPQWVPRGDYTRVLAEFWADGPDSETPPGHWFTILNYVNDRPELQRRFNGQGPLLDSLEWDVKAYLLLGGAMHDAAITAWGIKGWYDYVRPVSAVRAMAARGQRSDPLLPSFDPAGLPLIAGRIELVGSADPLAGSNGEHTGKIKVYAWRGPQAADESPDEIAGVGWILAENWWPFQRASFVTPPFAGYISGHSTYSRAAAEVLSSLTGDPFFPGGMGEFIAPAATYLDAERGPSVPVHLQWATYTDASDQCSLSRIWGGIHPPVDDIPGRVAGIAIADRAFRHARQIFYRDEDGDGFYSYEDCDDSEPGTNPLAAELCDGIDNNCDGRIDEDLPLFTYFRDADGDGFGNFFIPLDTCRSTPPDGFAANSLDCDDSNPGLSPLAAELCDGIDNNCDGRTDENLPLFTYFRDTDGDGFGDFFITLDTCRSTPPDGFVANNLDCDDSEPGISPLAAELCDGIDNNCDGRTDENLPLFTYFRDTDGDGFGDFFTPLDTCRSTPPDGFVTNSLDCDDSEPGISPLAAELCDGIDNNCDDRTDENLPLFIYFRDADGDGFGDFFIPLDTCRSTPPDGFVTNSLDCDDQRAGIFPGAAEIADNGIDEDCSGLDLYLQPRYFPNPVDNQLHLRLAATGTMLMKIYAIQGQLVAQQSIEFADNQSHVFLGQLAAGWYYFELWWPDGRSAMQGRVLKK
jgi:Putative metal-binding motif